MNSIIDLFLGSIASKLHEKITSYIIEVFTTLIDFISILSENVFDDAIISFLINASTTVSFIVFGLSLVALCANMLENLEKLDIKILALAILKGFLFATSAQLVATFIFHISSLFVTTFNSVLDPVEYLEVHFSTLETSLFIMLILIIAFLIFGVLSAVSLASILIHIITSFLYIPFIVQGDSSKIGDWFKHSISISLSYLLRYLFFYFSIVSFMSFSYASLILLIMAFTVGKGLKEWGYTTGVSQGLSQSVHGASMAVSTLRGVLSK